MAFFLAEFPRAGSRLRRPTLGYLLALFSGVAGVAVAAPNIVFIVSDDAGYNDFGFMADHVGNATDMLTPNLDALANRSVLLPSAYATGAVCSPSRAGFLTGRYGQRIGYEDNPGDFDGLPASQQIMPHHLKNLGYTTGALGKWHLGEIDGVNRPQDLGFDEFYGFLGGGRPFFGLGSTDAGRAMRRGDTIIESTWDDEGDASRYDPVKGRYLTDALGEEAVDFINRHANDAQPFFLYASLNAPHTPLNTKQSDYDLFAHIADPNRRAVVAMTYALDRAVGDITNALVANGIDENTVVVFMNDNGGPSTAPHSNYPLRGNKGSLWEGGIRVPMLISAPGLRGDGNGAPLVYDEPVMSFDLMPTFVSLAGGDADAIETDGTDLMPFLSGDIASDPHEVLLWRGIDGRFAVRKGDWKLVRPGAATFARLHNVVDEVNENTYLNAQNPHIVQDLLRELTYWESQMDKPQWGALGASMNRFDHFVFRNDLATSSNWNLSNAWYQGGTLTSATLRPTDAYANAVLEFGTRNDADYTATNNMTRATNQLFMLNQIRLTGDYSGTSNRVGTINGNAVLFAKSLDGANPQIHTDATAIDESASFTFNISNELQLLDDLEITGDGTQNFVFTGNIRDYDVPRNLVKSGSSTVTFSGNNTFAGTLTINGGRVRANNFSGGLQNNAGYFSAGALPGPAMVNVGGNFSQGTAGTLEIEIAGDAPGTSHDQLTISGTATLGGTLQVKLIDGFVPEIGEQFELLYAMDGIIGRFDELLLPFFGDSMFLPVHMSNSLVLKVALQGDFNDDGSVDAADYVTWRKNASLGSYQVWQTHFGEAAGAGSFALEADYNSDGIVEAADYVVWRKSGDGTHYEAWKSKFASSNSAGGEGVPEPSGALVIQLTVAAFMLRRHR